MAASIGAAGIVHLAAVVPALLIGALMLARRKGSAAHRRWGRLWVVLMLLADVSAFWLQRDGYSWIHGLAVVNAASVSAAVVCIRLRRRVAHAAFVIGAYAGTVAAGMGALMPGRFLHQLLLGA